MPAFTRFAVYYAPEPGPLADFGAAWLGWDAAAGSARAHPDIAGLPRPAAEITQTPRKYGFHGTIKPPFRLAPGSTPETLAADLSAFCAAQAPVTLESLALTRIGSFLALTPTGDCSALSHLAAETVATLDRHRAPPSDAELSRRRGNGLTPSQEENLARWGYPYVMEEFRFHLTLTGRLSAGEARTVIAALEPALAPLLPRPFEISSLCLFGEAPDGRFHLLSRHKLTGRA